MSSDTYDTDIAVVGMAGRFAGARNLAEYWANLRAGVDSITRFSDGELRAAGVPEAELADPNYVKAGAVLPDMEGFDAGFFGFNPREAAILDPQHRHFLECCWEALEDAGHDPARFGGAVGVFGGSGHNAYLPYNLLTNPKLMAQVGFFLVRHTGNDKDFLTTRVSYLLDLKGPSLNVQTACSTSLVAMHAAGQSLLARECDMALAGGVTIELPHRQGYLYREGEILSPDGRCHAFDAGSQGTVFGSGVGVVVLRRLADALADGDHIHCVIKGSAVNNDGAGKVGYLAPSVDGQAQCIAEALAVANVSADTIGYVEAHGTGTPVGDPIEVAALTQAFRQSTDAVAYCGLGSVKPNIGHTDTAAGVASFIKVALAMQHRELPPSLHFQAPNPACDFEHSPFVVQQALAPWAPRPGAPLRAGVSSLGVGGTNAHVVLEEAPVRPAPGPAREHQLVLLSARTPAALDAATQALAAHLGAPGAPALPEAAYTLQLGRKAMAHRRVLVARDAAEAATTLAGGDPQRLFTQAAAGSPPGVAFMFAGGGAQHPGMGAGLYASEPVYRDTLDECLQHLSALSPLDFRAALFPPAGLEAAAAQALERPALALPALLAVQVAQARLWQSWGIEPAAMIGHSMGEYTAAHLAGVFSLRDALAVVALRGRLFETLPEGAMLSVALPAGQLQPRLAPTLSIAAVNGPALCVAAGPVHDITALQQALEADEVDTVRVRIAVAAHSSMLEPILAEFGAGLRGLSLKPPQRPFVSNLSGTWIAAEEATDPAYWVRHLRQTVRFADGLGTLLAEPQRILLEVGPGRTLATLARQHPQRPAAMPVLNSLRHPDETLHDQAYMLAQLGRLWAHGVEVDWARLHRGQPRQRVPLPTYPFEHQRHWVDPGRPMALAAPAENAASLARQADIGRWFYQPQWQRCDAPAPAAGLPPGPVLLVDDDEGLADTLAQVLAERGHTALRARHDDDFGQRLAEWAQAGTLPGSVMHCALVAAAPGDPWAGEAAAALQERGFYSLLALAQALGQQDGSVRLPLLLLCSHVQRVAGETLLAPAKATALGLARVLPREMPHLAVRSIDLVWPATPWARQRLARHLVDELGCPDGPETTAWRAQERWQQVLQPATLAEPAVPALTLRRHGVYLITGGLGGVGLALAQQLAAGTHARLALLGRRGLPPPEQWDAALRGPDAALARRVAQVRSLQAQGAEVLVLAADVADDDALRAALAQVRARFGALHGVLHAAGAIDDGVVLLKTREGAARVLAPKLQGTLNLQRALAGQALDFVLLFSSISSFSGLAGQADYAAANAFLDAAAQAAAAGAGPYTVALNWSAWAEAGMAADMGRALGIAADDDPTAARPLAHPLLQQCLVHQADHRVYASRLSPQQHWLLGEHRLRNGPALVPGSGFVELVRAAVRDGAADGPVELRELTFLAPFAVADEHARELRVELRRSAAGWQVAVRSRANGTWLEHARGLATDAPAELPAPLDLAAVRRRCPRAQPMRGDEQPPHLHFGPRWANLHHIDWGSTEALLQLRLPAAHVDDLPACALHPALLDMATAGAQALVPGFDPAADFFVPASYGRLRLHSPLQVELVSHVRWREDGSEGKELACYDVTLATPAGTVLAEVQGFTMMRVRDRALLAAAPEAEPQPQTPAPAPRQHATANHVLELGLREGIRNGEGAEVVRRVLAAGAGPQVVVSPQDLGALLARLREPASPAAPAGAAAASSAKDEPGPDLSPLVAALQSHEAVRAAAAGRRAGRVVAWFTCQPQHSPTVSELRRHVRALVDDTLVPQSFVELEQMPLAADGSVDTAALPSPFADEQAAVGPRTATERTIASLWADLLGTAQVGVHDNFFDIGGHSLLSVRFIARLNKATGVRLLHEHVVMNTLEQLAAKVDAASPAASNAPTPAASPPATPQVVPAESAAAVAAAPEPKAGGLFDSLKRAVRRGSA